MPSKSATDVPSGHCKHSYVSKPDITSVTLSHTLAGVDADMFTQTTALSKRLPTHVTAERSFACVDASMFLIIKITLLS